VRDSAARQRFEDIWNEHYAAIFAFARRRLSADEAAQDVAADTFLVAWRRLDEVPDEPRAWLLKVARNVLSNYGRGRGRRQALQARLIATRETPTTDAPREATDGLAAAFNRLKPSDREALALVAWEELKPREAAQALGITAPRFSLRLHRAKQRLRKELAASGHVESGTPDEDVGLGPKGDSPDLRMETR
jgi:RNA polymerase sigma factor (sigma-70 family)